MSKRAGELQSCLEVDAKESVRVNADADGWEAYETIDVQLTTPTDGQVLKYNSTQGLWINANESGGGGVSDEFDFGTFADPVDFTLDMGAF